MLIGLWLFIKLLFFFVHLCQAMQVARAIVFLTFFHIRLLIDDWITLEAGRSLVCSVAIFFYIVLLLGLIITLGHRGFPR